MVIRKCKWASSRVVCQDNSCSAGVLTAANGWDQVVEGWRRLPGIHWTRPEWRLGLGWCRPLAGWLARWLAASGRSLAASSALPDWNPPVASPRSPAIPFKTVAAPCRDACSPSSPPIEPSRCSTSGSRKKRLSRSLLVRSVYHHLSPLNPFYLDCSIHRTSFCPFFIL